MTKTFRDLQPGDMATTHYESDKYKAVVTITARDDAPKQHCQSGLMYRVSPALRGNTLDTWYDAAWFTPIESSLTRRACP